MAYGVLAYGVAHRREALLVFCHYIAFIKFIIMMEIIGVRYHLKMAVLKLFQCEIKKIPVIGLEFYDSVIRKNTMESVQELP